MRTFPMLQSDRDRLERALQYRISVLNGRTQGSTPEEYQEWVRTQVLLEFYRQSLVRVRHWETVTSIDKELLELLDEGGFEPCFKEPGSHVDRIFQVLKDLGFGYRTNRWSDLLVDATEDVEAAVIIDRCIDMGVNVHVYYRNDGVFRVTPTWKSPRYMRF